MRYGIRQPLCLAPSCSLLSGFCPGYTQMARTQKNKATSGHLGMLKVRPACACVLELSQGYTRCGEAYAANS